MGNDKFTKSALQGFFSILGRGDVKLIDVDDPSDDHVSRGSGGDTWEIGVGENFTLLDHLHRAGHQKYTMYAMSGEIAKHAADPNIKTLAAPVEDARVDVLTSRHFDKPVLDHHRGQVDAHTWERFRELIEKAKTGTAWTSDLRGMFQLAVQRVAFDLDLGNDLPRPLLDFVNYFRGDILKVRESGEPLDAARLAVRMAKALGYFADPKNFPAPPPPPAPPSEKDDKQEQKSGESGGDEKSDEKDNDDSEGESDENESKSGDEGETKPSDESSDESGKNDSEDESEISPDDEFDEKGYEAGEDEDENESGDDSEDESRDADDEANEQDLKDDSEEGTQSEANQDENSSGSDQDSETGDGSGEDEASDGSGKDDANSESGESDDSLTDSTDTSVQTSQDVLDQIEAQAKATFGNALRELANELATANRQDRHVLAEMIAHPVDAARTGIMRTSLGHEYAIFNVDQEKTELSDKFRFDLEDERDVLRVRRSKSGLVTRDAWKVNIGKLDVFNRPPPKKGRIAVMIDGSGSMGCPCRSHNRLDSSWYASVTNSWLAYQIAGGIAARFEDAVIFTYSTGRVPDSRTGKWHHTVIIAPIVPGYQPVCSGTITRGLLYGSTPDCVALEYLYDRLIGDISGAFAVVISDGAPNAPYDGHGEPFDSDGTNAPGHTQALADMFKTEGLRYASVMLGGYGNVSLYPSDLTCTVKGLADLGDAGRVITDIVRTI